MIFWACIDVTATEFPAHRLSSIEVGVPLIRRAQNASFLLREIRVTHAKSVEMIIDRAGSFAEAATKGANLMEDLHER